MKKEYFTFHRNYYNAIEALETNKEKLQAYQLLCCYGLNREEPDLSEKKLMPTLLFRNFQLRMDLAEERNQAKKRSKQKHAQP